MKTLRQICSAIVILAMLVGFLPVGVQSASAAEDVTYNVGSDNVTITESGIYTITGSTTTHTITVNSGVTATITLSNVTIDRSEITGTAFDIQSGANVTLILEGTNTLTGGGYDDFYAVMAAPGIHLPSGAALTIQGNGSLTVTGGDGDTNGYGGAGIGGNNSITGPSAAEACGTITILSGTVEVKGGGGVLGGVGIGGGTSSTSGSGGAGGNVTIRDGSVTITGGIGSIGAGGTGIGGGAGFNSANGGAGGTVIITGGTVTVTGGNGGYGGAGIGGGASGSAGGDGGTVVILTPATITGGEGTGTGSIDDGVNIGGGQGSSDGGNGQGIRPNTGGNNTYEVYGDLELPDGVEIPSGVTVTIPDGSTLTIPSGTTLTNNGTITGEGTLDVEGAITGNGTLGGSVTVDKGSQSAPSAPTTTTVTAKSVTLNQMSGGVAGVQYACVQGSDSGVTAPADDNAWTNSTTFSGLTAGTAYTFYARYAGNNYYNPSPASSGLTVITPPDIITNSLPNGTVGTSYSQKIASSVTGVTWSITSGSLPGGLSLNATSGEISGTPTAAGNFTFTVEASFTVGGTMVTGTKELSISIAPGNTGITITSGSGTYTYGSTITVSGTTSGIPNGATLTLGDSIATTTVQDGAFSFSYNTSSKKISATGASQQLTVSYAGNSDYSSASANVSVTLNPKPVTATVTNDITKVYDGETRATVTLAVVSSDLVNSNDQITVTGTGTYQSADVADSISVTVSNIQTGGADKDWYSVSAPTGVTGSITQSGSSLNATATNSNLTYGDTLEITVAPSATKQSPTNNALTPQAAGNTVELYKGDTLLVGTSEKNDDGTYTLTYNTTGKGLTIGDNELTVQFKGDTNMAASSTTVQVTLNTKAVTASVSGTLEKTYDTGTGITVALAVNDTATGDSLTGTVSGNFADANAGEGKSITLGTNATWTDMDTAGFYNISLPTDVTGTITRAAISNRPVITGSAIPGGTLTASYTPVTGETVSYQWNLGGSPISGATGDTYTVRETDVGDEITVTATATDGNHTGSMTSDAVTAGKAEQDAPGPNEGYTIDYRAETITVTSDDYELSTDSAATSGSATLNVTPGTDVYIRFKETDTHNPSPWTTVTIPSRPAAPQNVRGGTNSITNVNSTMEYRAANSDDWTAITGERVTNLRAGSYLVRFQATDSAFASERASVTVRDYVAPPTTPSEPEKPSGPSTGDSEGWTSITDELDKLNPDTQEEPLTIEMNGETEVPKEVFETIAGKDVDVVFDMGDGVSWSVNGADIPADADLSNLDLGVSMNTDGIPVDVINAITGEATSVQITLAHDGDFGFALTLSAPLGEENAGYWANLYHYDEANEAMDFETAALIDDDGTANLRMTHASQYAIVIDDHPHETVLPFTDVNANDWFYDPVVWAYDNGLMTGTSATTFEPNTSTTRAMIVAILNRLEDGPTADGGTFTDVRNGDWYAEAVNWAASVGIVAGFEDGTFRPNAPITREQMAAILYNYAQWKGMDVSSRADLSRYSDQPSPWANDVMQWAVAEGLISGTSATTLDPQGSATRAQVASILQRFLAD